MELVVSRDLAHLAKAIGTLKDPIVISKLANRLARMYKAKLVHNIKNNEYGFQLALSTMHRHKLISGEYTPLILTQAYVNSIYVYGGRVSVKSGTHYSGLRYAELSFILEYGRLDKSIPARPVWTNTLRDFLPSANKTVDRILAKSMRDSIK